MIKIEVIKDNDKLKKITITGHAKYDKYGKDIVCAAVSSIVTTTVNAIEKLDKEAIFYDESIFLIEIRKENDIVNTLLINMLDLLKELENDYPKNIKFL